MIWQVIFVFGFATGWWGRALAKYLYNKYGKRELESTTSDWKKTWKTKKLKSNVLNVTMNGIAEANSILLSVQIVGRRLIGGKMEKDINKIMDMIIVGLCFVLWISVVGAWISTW